MYNFLLLSMGVCTSLIVQCSANEVNITVLSNIRKACDDPDVLSTLRLVCKANFNTLERLSEINNNEDLTNSQRVDLAKELILKSDRDVKEFNKLVSVVHHYDVRRAEIEKRQKSDAHV